MEANWYCLNASSHSRFGLGEFLTSLEIQRLAAQLLRRHQLADERGSGIVRRGFRLGLVGLDLSGGLGTLLRGFILRSDTRRNGKGDAGSAENGNSFVSSHRGCSLKA